MTIKFIANIYDFKIKMHGNLTLGMGSILSHDQKIKDTFKTLDFIEQIGKIDASALFSDNTFVYWEYSFNELSKNEVRKSENLKNSFLELLDSFINYLWLLKDNSINLGNYYFYEQSDNISRSYKIVNYSQVTNANCQHKIQVLSLGEMIKICNIVINASSAAKAHYEEILETLQTKSKKQKRIKGAEITYRHYDPLLRGFYFLNLARRSDFLPYRISLYMPILESLFCCGIASEVTQRVSERTAVYIGKTSKEREGIFKKIKEAYLLRSRYLHGDSLEYKHHSVLNLRRLSRDIDAIVRKVLVKIVMKDAHIFNDIDKLDKHLNDMILR